MAQPGEASALVTTPPSGPDRAPDFGAWVVARAPALTRFAYVLTGSVTVADSVVVEALARARLCWRRLGGAADLETWLQDEAVRRYAGRRRRRHAVDPGDTADGPDPGRPASTRDSGPSREATAVWQRCAGLPPRGRAVLVLCSLRAVGPRAAASVLRVRHGTALAELDAALDVAAPGPRRLRGERLRRVATVFTEYADTVPAPHAPAERALTRARRRRRGLTALAATAATALAVPVALAYTAGGGATGREPVPAVPLDAATPDTSGWRWESWGGVQVQVPGEWGHADLTQWCVAEGTGGPAVDRPELVSTDALCSLGDDGRATYTGGLVLRRAQDALRLSRADVAPYATTRIHTVGGVTLTVVDIAPAVGTAILDSAEVVGRRDFNGCRPRRATAARPGADPAARVGDLGGVASVAVCRYGLVGWRTPTLISSRRLGGAAATRLAAALRRAPAGDPTSAPRGCRHPARELAVLEVWPREGDPASVVVRYSGCGGHAVHEGGRTRRLTAAVLRPVLVPPWSGWLPPDVRRVVRR